MVHCIVDDFNVAPLQAEFDKSCHAVMAGLLCATCRKLQQSSVDMKRFVVLQVSGGC
jgi:hypothetical protein